MVFIKQERTNGVLIGRSATMPVSFAENNKKQAAAAAVPPRSLTHGAEKLTTTTTDAVVVNLDIIPKLLFEGMVSPSVVTVENAVANLADIFRLSSNMRREAYEAGGHAVLVVAMKKWRLNESIQTSGCRCIQNMSCTNALVKESFAAVGGVEAVVTAMRTFPFSQRVQRSGCGALMNLLSESDTPESQAMHTTLVKFVKEYAGISLIVKAMKSFPNELKIQLWGNGLFQNLAQNKDYRLEMMQSGAVTVAGTSLELHYQDENIKQYARKFLTTMFA